MYFVVSHIYDRTQIDIRHKRYPTKMCVGHELVENRSNMYSKEMDRSQIVRRVRVEDLEHRVMGVNDEIYRRSSRR